MAGARCRYRNSESEPSIEPAVRAWSNVELMAYTSWVYDTGGVYG